MQPDVLAAINRHTPAEVAKGHRLFVSHRRGDTDMAHVRTMLHDLDVPWGGTVVDLGCGIGEFERIAATIRPDIDWWMVNLSSVQIDMCPKGPNFHARIADATSTYLTARSFDRVLFHNSLVQMNLMYALIEARRLVKPGGRIVLWEMLRHAGDNTEWMVKLAGHVATKQEFLSAVQVAGLSTERMHPVPADDSYFRGMLGTDAHMLNDVQPWLVVLTRTNNGG